MLDNESVLICYRGACTAAAHPCGYNRVTQAIYCIQCAETIDGYNKDRSLFPLLPMVSLVTSGGAYVEGTIIVRSQ